jgi:hypothetical protein
MHILSVFKGLKGIKKGEKEVPIHPPRAFMPGLGDAIKQ